MTRATFRFGAFCSLAVSVLCIWIPSAHAQTLLPAETYARHPGFSVASLSPNGDLLAIAVPEDGGDRLAIVSMSDPENRKAFQFANSVITDIEWYGDEAAIVQVLGRFSTIPYTSLRSYIAYATTDDAPEFIDYLPPVTDPQAGGGRSFVWSLYDVVDFAPEEDAYFLMGAYVSRQQGMQQFGSSTPNIWGYDLLRTYVNGGQARAFVQGTEFTARWITDGNENILARIDVLNSGRQIINIDDGSRFVEIASLDDAAGTGGDIMGLSLDGSAIVVRARRDQRTGLYPVSLTDGSWGEAIYYNDQFDVGDVLLDERTHRVNGIVYQQGMLTRYTYFDPEMQSLQETLEDAFADHSIKILSQSDDGNNVLFEISAPNRPPALGVFDREALNVETVSESYPDLIGAGLGEVSTVQYATADGSMLTGVLTVPSGAPAQNLPLFVLEDTTLAPTFDALAHFLASRGYAAFRPGIRSLRRIGDVSGMEELDDWVLTMQEDYSTGIDQLVANGTVDAARVCIYGEGDEGYTARMGTIISSDAYRCAIAASPLTDLKRLITWARFASTVSLISMESPLVRNYDRYADDDLERLSPITRAAEINAGILLTDFEEGEQGASMEAALRRAGKPSELIEFDEGYNEPADARAENAILTYTAMERFLAEQLGQ